MGARSDGASLRSRGAARRPAARRDYCGRCEATGADGKGLPGVQVSANRDQQVTTAADGRYALVGLAPGDCLVEALRDGVALAPTYRVVHLVDADIRGIDFYVLKEPLPVNASAQPMRS